MRWLSRQRFRDFAAALAEAVLPLVTDAELRDDLGRLLTADGRADLAACDEAQQRRKCRVASKDGDAALSVFWLSLPSVRDARYGLFTAAMAFAAAAAGPRDVTHVADYSPVIAILLRDFIHAD